MTLALELTEDERALAASVARAGTEVFQPLADAWGEQDDLNRGLARALGKEGLFPLLIPTAYGGALDGPFRSMTLCLIREELARTCLPAEELFAIQGLGSYPILLAGTRPRRPATCPRWRAATRCRPSPSPSPTPAPTRRRSRPGPSATATAGG